MIRLVGKAARRKATCGNRYWSHQRLPHQWLSPVVLSCCNSLRSWSQTRAGQTHTGAHMHARGSNSISDNTRNRPGNLCQRGPPKEQTPWWDSAAAKSVSSRKVGRKRGWWQHFRLHCFSKRDWQGRWEVCLVTCQRSLVSLGNEPVSAFLPRSLAGRGLWEAGPLHDGQRDFKNHYCVKSCRLPICTESKTGKRYPWGPG